MEKKSSTPSDCKEEKKEQEKLTPDEWEEVKQTCRATLGPNEIFLECVKCGWFSFAQKRSDNNAKTWCGRKEPDCNYVWCSRCNQEWKNGHEMTCQGGGVSLNDAYALLTLLNQYVY